MIVDILKSEYSRRRVSNPAYSLRAFANFLDISPGRLSEYFNGKRSITNTAQKKIMRRLQLEDFFYLNEQNFQDEKTAEALLLSDTTFNIISNDLHYSILSLMDTKGFVSDVTWIASRLNCEPLDVRLAIERLISVGLLKKVGHQLVKLKANLKTSSDIEKKAIKEAHLNVLKHASEALMEIPIELREISTVTFAIDMKKIKLAKQLITNFRRRLCALLETPSASEVYRLNIQLIPISKITQSEGVHDKA